MFTPKSVLHWGLPAHLAKYSPSETFSACSTWPNYIQSEGKDSPLWSIRDRPPTAGWLVWHLMLLSTGHFSRTDVFEGCLKRQTVERVCIHIACVYAHAHVFGTSGERCVTCEVSCGPFFLKKDHPWWRGDGEDRAGMHFKGEVCLLWNGELGVIILIIHLITD